MTEKKNPDYFIQEAAKTVVQRGKENGYDKDEERSARSVAVMFNEMHPGFNLTEEHIWDIMLCLKLKRNANQPREDNIIDLIGYASLRGESQSAPKKVKPSLHEKRGPSMDAKKLGWWLEPRNGLKAQSVKIAELSGGEIISDNNHYYHGPFFYPKDKWELKEYK